MRERLGFTGQSGKEAQLLLQQATTDITCSRSQLMQLHAGLQSLAAKLASNSISNADAQESAAQLLADVMSSASSLSTSLEDIQKISGHAASIIRNSAVDDDANTPAAGSRVASPGTSVGGAPADFRLMHVQMER